VKLSTRARLVRAARYAAYAALALVALVVAAALVAPAFLDTQRVENELQAKLSEAVHGTVAWERLEIRLLPSPRGALRVVRVDIPGTANLGAAEVDVLLRLLPLLSGRAEIASVSLSKPVIALKIAPSPGPENAADPLEAYRAAVDAIRKYAPEAVLDVDDADLDVRAPGLPPLRLRKLEVHAKTGSSGLEIDLQAESEYWSGLKLSARVAFADSSGTASLEVEEARPQVWLDRFLADSPVSVAIPAAALAAQARTDGRERLECDFDLGVPSVEIARASQRLQVPDVALAGTVAVGRQEIALRLKSAQLGASKLADGSLHYSPKDKFLSGAAGYDLDLAQAMDGARRMLAQEAGEAFEAIGPVSGRAQGQVKVDAKRSGWSVQTQIRQSDASVGIKGLPGPVRLAGAAVEVTRDAVRIARAALSMLDASAAASASIAWAPRLQISGAVSEGAVGEEALAWIWKSADLPPRLVLKAPVRIAVQKAAWRPKGPLELQASASFDAGPDLAVDLGWSSSAIEVRRAAIKDARSDAVLALRAKGGLFEGKFSGSLTSVSLASALKSAKLPSGGASGELRFSFDRRHPERISAEGKLKGEAIDLEWLLGRPVRIEGVDLEAGAGALRIRAADINWAEQRVKLRGDVRYGGSGPVVDAQLDSPGVVVDALLPPANVEEKPKSVEEEGDFAKRWFPLPVTGRIAVRSDFVQSGRFKVAPFAGTLALEAKKAHLDLQKAQVCGLSLPLTADATPEGFAVEVHITAKQQQLEETARCLTERGVLMTGTFDLAADLRTRGRKGESEEFKRNLEGTVRAESREGRIMKFPLIAKILAIQNVSALFKEGGAKVDSTGLPYRNMSAAGRFEKGRFVVDESGSTIPPIGLAATGSISLIDYDSKLTVLVAPIAALDRVVRAVPIVGYITGGILTNVPVAVSGDIRDPWVVVLGPEAVFSELAGMLERTVKLPGKLVPTPGGQAPAKPEPIN
jgi:AsmA-like protein